MGTGIPNDAAIADACMALYSRTRPGMKKHSMKLAIPVKAAPTRVTVRQM
jgi:hypothetical protein